MFKKVFRTLASKFSQRDDARAGPESGAGKPGGLLAKIGSAVGKVQSKFQSAEAAAASKAASKTPEQWCEITPGMSRDQIKARLALLYRRFNRATSSLDPKLRAEAEIMLDAIVAVREKTFGPI